jgi:hypothetical protein
MFVSSNVSSITLKRSRLMTRNEQPDDQERKDAEAVSSVGI